MVDTFERDGVEVGGRKNRYVWVTDNTYDWKVVDAS